MHFLSQLQNETCPRMQHALSITIHSDFCSDIRATTKITSSNWPGLFFPCTPPTHRIWFDAWEELGINNGDLPVARGSLAPGSTVQELARFLPLSPLPKGLAYPALHRSQNPGSPGTSQESEARQGRKRLSESALLPVWLTAPSIPAFPPFPPLRTVREPVSPSTQCALRHWGSASPPGEGCPGQFGSHCGHPSGFCERFPDSTPSTCWAAAGDCRCGHPPSN